jgi:hypothetical protein
MAICDTCGKGIDRSQGHTVSEPQAASIMHSHYEKIAEHMGMGEDYVEICLDMAANAGNNLVCSDCFNKIQTASGNT